MNSVSEEHRKKLEWERNRKETFEEYKKRTRTSVGFIIFIFILIIIFYLVAYFALLYFSEHQSYNERKIAMLNIGENVCNAHNDTLYKIDMLPSKSTTIIHCINQNFAYKGDK